MIRDMTPSGTRQSSGAQAAVPPRSPRIHINALRGLPDVLERFGVRSEPVLRAANLTRADFEDPERSASFSDMDRLIGTCVRRTNCGHFGLLLSKYADLQSFGIAGRLARHAPSVGAALNELSAHFMLHDSGGVPSVAIHSGCVTFAYGIHAPGLRHADQVYDLSVGAMINVMRQLCGVNWHPDVILLPRSRPPDIRPYREILGVPVRFNSMQAALQFPEAWLSRPIVDADALLHSLLADRAAADMVQQGPSLHGDVQRAIRLLLTTGQCSRDEVARRLGTHPRTLGRRLQASGTTFQQLLDETRTEIAKQLLRDTRITVARVALSLGYQDPTIFTRAFARWTGRTPSAFRAATDRT